MSTIIDFKIEENDLEVEYSIITPIDLETPISKEKSELIEAISKVDSYILANQDIIDNLNMDIDRLTNHSDGIDYTLAVGSGVITGLIDAFFTREFSLDNATKWGKEKVDSFVKSVAQKKGYKGNSMTGAVSFLEKEFPIPADSLTNSFGGGYGHHLRDFSHHPTPIGLMFSILTQFTGKVYGTNTEGAFIIVPLENKELIGKNFQTKISIGVTHWFFHMVSDMSGSSSSISKGKYGTGIPGPIVSLLKEISSTKLFSHTKNNNGVCLWISKLFNGTLLSERDTNGKIIPDSVIKFDLRTELGIMNDLKDQGKPVLLNDIIVRVAYFIKRLITEFKTKKIETLSDFKYKIDWKNTLPYKNRTITRMLTIASGTFVAIDVADAAIRSGLKSGGEPAVFFTNLVLRVNFVGIGRFAIAINTDVYMGYKKGKLRNELLYRKSEHLMLNTAKIAYKQKGMWLSARDTYEAIVKMESITKTSIVYFRESLTSIGIDLESISMYKTDIETNNPELLTDISKLIKYGKY